MHVHSTCDTLKFSGSTVKVCNMSAQIQAAWRTGCGAHRSFLKLQMLQPARAVE